MPCFEGLFLDSCNKLVLDLLFTLAFWHGYAKLRLHSDSSLRVLEGATKVFGTLIRKFKSTICPRYKTKLTPREQDARTRRQTKSKGKGKGKAKGIQQTESAVEYVFNICTYKMHAMGDYPSTIQRMGTTDNFNSQNVSISSICTVTDYVLG